MYLSVCKNHKFKKSITCSSCCRNATKQVIQTPKWGVCEFIFLKFNEIKINTNNEEIKLSDRIFLSDSELRGFTYRGVGPKVSNEFIGGNYSYSTNFSSTIPNGLPDSWAARTNIFFDVANVWGTDFSGALDGNKIRSSTGVGLEWTSPLGPLSFTYALPITKDSTDSIENFSFKLGGTF